MTFFILLHYWHKYLYCCCVDYYRVASRELALWRNGTVSFSGLMTPRVEAKIWTEDGRVLPLHSTLYISTRLFCLHEGFKTWQREKEIAHEELCWPYSIQQFRRWKRQKGSISAEFLSYLYYLYYPEKLDRLLPIPNRRPFRRLHRLQLPNQATRTT